MTGVVFNVSELVALAADLGKVSGAQVPAITAVVVKAGDSLKDAWKSNATATAGAHGVHYPKAITAELKGGIGSISVEVGPESGMPQGGMSFEYGSVNQPPHMDGNKAADVEEPKFIDAVTKVATEALTGL